MATRTSQTQVEPGQQQSLAFQLDEAITKIGRRLRGTRPVGELTIGQLSLLSILDATGGLTPQQLADVERVQAPTIARMVASLEVRALVQRLPHPTDRRQVILIASPEGRQLLATHRRADHEWLAQRIAELNEDERAALMLAAEILVRIYRE